MPLVTAMDKTSNKRPADSEQTVDTFAVCANCSRLSYNLKQCDKCGSALSEDNASMCVSAEPKRSRLESPANSNGSTVIINGNGNSSHTGDDSDRASPSTPAQPVPQALYVNKNNVPTSGSSEEEAVRPKALYMNVNNQIHSSRLSVDSPRASPPIVSSVVSGSTSQASLGVLEQAANHLGSSTAVISIPSSPSDGVAPSNRSNTSTNSSSSFSASVSSGGIGNLQIRTTQQSGGQVQPSSLVLSSATTAVSTASTNKSFETFNLPPPPPYSGNNPPPGQPAAATSAENTNMTPESQEDSSSVIGELTINPDTVAMPATQIRIGTRKFLPASSITFKEDGVLFALKDFTHAPVLLNARAIIKCQANLDQYPVFFIFLEATCIRQIRNIFGLTIDEFQENSPVNLKKCITIFPSIAPSTSKAIREKMSVTIRNIFTKMSSRYPRPGAYLNEISNMSTIDVLFESMRSQRSSDVIPRGMSPSRSTAAAATVVTPNTISQLAMQNSATAQYTNRAVTSVAAPTRLSQPPNSVAPLSYSQDTRLPTSSMIRVQIPSRDPLHVAGGTVQRIPVQSVSRTVMPVRPGTAQRMVTSVRPQTVQPPVTAQVRAAQPAVPAKSSASMAGTTAPLLVVPSDAQKWRDMQKDLVEGGVYHVELPSKERKYYLWDGSRLVPCLVQNTEIQLNCVYCRIGSLRAEVSNCKVRADDPSGISCVIKSEHTSTVPLCLSLNMISSITSCFDKHCIMFVTLNYNGWWNIQNLLKLSGDRDPCFNPNATNARRKHLVFIFKNVNHDQRDALLGIKHKHGGTSVFMQAPITVVNKLMTEIMKDICFSQGKNHRVYNYDAPLMDFMQIDRPGILADDDDDDVIMTSEEVGIKCPYTQQVMKEPVKNKICEHNYEKMAIQEFIVRKKGNAKCPYAGCGNAKPLSMLDLEENRELQLYIQRDKSKS